MRWVLAIAGAAPLLAISITLVMIWIEPMSVAEGGWLRLAASLVVIEFLLLHSGAFMSVGPAICKKHWQQIAWFLGFALFYGLFFAGISVMVGGNHVVWLLTGVLLTRLVTLLIIRDKRGTVLMLTRSTVGMVILLLTMLVALIPWPGLGITETVRYETFGSAQDMLSEHPQRLIAWGVLYYFLMALVEGLIGWRLPDWKEEDVDDSWQALGQRG